MPVLALLLAAAQAPAPPPPAAIDAAQGQAIVSGCAAHASAKRQSHSIAVVDRGGRMVAALRMDGNGYGVMDFALAKAEAAAAWGFATAQMAEAVVGTPGFAQAPHVVTVAGGVPVFDGEGRRRLGAVGVSGEAPSDDEACARAGIAAAGLRSEPVR